MTEIDYKALARWATSGATGGSSKAIAGFLTEGKCDGSYPHDGGDFGRCERLLDTVPGLRERFPKMAEANRYWAVLVPRWDEIKAAPENQRCDLIQSIVRPVEDRDPRVVRLGMGGTIRFGSIR